MIGHFRGIEYYIILDEAISYYEVIPDIEKEAKMRVKLLDNGKTIRMIKMRGSDERLLKSEYYEKRKDTWFESDHKRCKIDENETQDITLSGSEEKLRDVIMRHPGIKVEEEGWYDVSYCK